MTNHMSVYRFPET